MLTREFARDGRVERSSSPAHRWMGRAPERGDTVVKQVHYSDWHQLSAWSERSNGFRTNPHVEPRES